MSDDKKLINRNVLTAMGFEIPVMWSPDSTMTISTLKEGKSPSLAN